MAAKIFESNGLVVVGVQSFSGCEQKNSHAQHVFGGVFWKYQLKNRPWNAFVVARAHDPEITPILANPIQIAILFHRREEI